MGVRKLSDHSGFEDDNEVESVAVRSQGVQQPAMRQLVLRSLHVYSTL
jgi:hypothetical protein